MFLFDKYVLKNMISVVKVSMGKRQKYFEIVLSILLTAHAAFLVLYNSRVITSDVFINQRIIVGTIALMCYGLFSGCWLAFYLGNLWKKCSQWEKMISILLFIVYAETLALAIKNNIVWNKVLVVVPAIVVSIIAFPKLTGSFMVICGQLYEHVGSAFNKIWSGNMINRIRKHPVASTIIVFATNGLALLVYGYFLKQAPFAYLQLKYFAPAFFIAFIFFALAKTSIQQKFLNWFQGDKSGLRYIFTVFAVLLIILNIILCYYRVEKANFSYITVLFGSPFMIASAWFLCSDYFDDSKVKRGKWYICSLGFFIPVAIIIIQLVMQKTSNEAKNLFEQVRYIAIGSLLVAATAFIAIFLLTNSIKDMLSEENLRRVGKYYLTAMIYAIITFFSILIALFNLHYEKEFSWAGFICWTCGMLLFAAMLAVSAYTMMKIFGFMIDWTLKKTGSVAPEGSQKSRDREPILMPMLISLTTFGVAIYLRDNAIPDEDNLIEGIYNLSNNFTDSTSFLFTVLCGILVIMMLTTVMYQVIRHVFDSQSPHKVELQNKIENSLWKMADGIVDSFVEITKIFSVIPDLLGLFLEEDFDAEFRFDFDDNDNNQP